MKNLMPCVLLALPLVSFAQDKHVHGEAELTIAFDKQAVAIEFKSPSANLVGFESAPQNVKELEAIKSVRALLMDYSNVVALNGGNCQQSAYDIEEGLEAKMASHEDHDDHNTHDDHKDHDKHEHHDERNDHHDDHTEHSDEVHSDFHVSYTLKCDDVSAVSSLAITGFSSFGGLETVDVDWVTANHQGSSDVNASSSRVDIKH